MLESFWRAVGTYQRIFQIGLRLTGKKRLIMLGRWEIHKDFLNKKEVGVHKVENATYNDYKELALELEQIGYKLEILN